MTAGIDMSLAMVEDDLGTEGRADSVARWLVMFLRRPGGQTQFAAPVWMPHAERSVVRTVQQSIEDDPGADRPHRPTRRGRHSDEPRHFTRVHRRGRRGARPVERIRVETARRRLEDSTDTVAVIVKACGFGTAETMRRAFVRRLGVPPDQYRRRFGSAA